MNYKRFISAILSICMLPAISIVKASAQSNEIVRYVVYDKEEDRALHFLKELGVETDFKDNETVTRGQFTSLLVNLAYNEDHNTKGENIFEDVTDECEYMSDIYFAYNRGIISKNNIFRPYDDITYAEAVTMATVALGYRIAAQNNGDYPYGYTKCASDIGLTDNVRKAASDKLSGLDVVFLLYNMLDIDFMTASFAEDAGYSVQIGSTILTERYNLKKIEGEVTSTVYSDLSGNSTIVDNHIKIDGVPFEYEGDAWDLLGMKVVAYIDDDKALIVCPVHNEILEADKAVDYDPVLFRLELEDGDRTKTVKLDSSFCFIYNGVAYPLYEKTDFTDINGSIKLVDNDGDRLYDVAFVYDVEYMKVSQINALDKVIYGNGVSRDSISFDEDSRIKFYKKDETEVEISPLDIVKDNIIALTISKDGKVGKVSVINNEFSGKIEAIDSDYIRIDGYDYKRSSHLNKYYTPTVGSKATFVLGLLDDIVLYEMEEIIGYRYGYLIKVKQDTDNESFLLTIFTENGEVEKFECAEKVLIDGKQTKLYKAWANSAVPLTDESNVTKRQLIKYKLNEGLITAIDTVSDAKKTTNSLKRITDNSNDCLLRYYDRIDTNYKSDGNMYTFLRFYINSQTKIFTVPKWNVTTVENLDFSLTDMSSLKNDKSYIIDAYDFDENGVPQVVVVYSDDVSNLNQSSDYGIVEKVKAVWNEELGLCQSISIWAYGKCSVYYIEDENKNLTNQIGAGDLVRYVQKNGIIKELTVDFDADTMDFTSASVRSDFVRGDAGFNKNRSYSLASVYHKTDTHYVVSWTNSGGVWDYSLDKLRSIPLRTGNSSTGIILVEDKKVRSLYPDEVIDYCSAGSKADRILLIQAYWQAANIVIYR